MSALAGPAVQADEIRLAGLEKSFRTPRGPVHGVVMTVLAARAYRRDTARV